MSRQLDSEGLQTVASERGHSDLEYGGPSSSAPESYGNLPGYGPKYEPDGAGAYTGAFNKARYDGYAAATSNGPERTQRICGMRRKWFWILIAVASIIVIAAAIGGGIGGSMANKSTNEAAPPLSTALPSGAAATSSAASSSGATTSSIPSTTATTTTTTSQPATTSTIVGPSSSVLYRDCPSSNGTVYNVALGAASLSYVKNCNALYPVDKSNSENFVNQPVQFLNDCIQLCAQWNVNDHTSSSGEPQTCNTVCWRNGFDGDDYPGTCFGYADTIVQGTAPSEYSTICDSAVWINQGST